MSLPSEVLIADIDVSEDLGVRNLLNHVMIKKIIPMSIAFLLMYL
jgi:hypothetical protein